MSFRDTELDQADVSRRVVKTSSTVGLPAGFEWEVSANSLGEPTLNVIHSESRRVVIYGV